MACGPGAGGKPLKPLEKGGHAGVPWPRAHRGWPGAGRHRGRAPGTGGAAILGPAATPRPAPQPDILHPAPRGAP